MQVLLEGSSALLCLRQALFEAADLLFQMAYFLGLLKKEGLLQLRKAFPRRRKTQANLFRLALDLLHILRYYFRFRLLLFQPLLKASHFFLLLREFERAFRVLLLETPLKRLQFQGQAAARRLLLF